MSSFNKKMDKPTKVRIILVCIILFVDIIFLPWVLKFPFFLAKDIAAAPSLWIEYGILRSMKDIFIDPLFRKLVLIMQLPVGALILGISWNVNKFKKKNKIQDGVGGPEPAGNGQHGTSRWQNEKEMDKNAKIWDTDEHLKAGGIVLGMEKSQNGKEKVWLDDDDTNTLIIGATRSGKSRKENLPSIWTLAKSGESMVIGDPKGELYITTKEYLEKEGYNVIVLNLREPLKGNQWNMLDMVNKAVDEGNISKATELAWDIANTITKQKPSTSSEPIWENGEESTIAALILASVMESEFKFQRHMSTVYYLLAEYGQPLEDGTVPLSDYMKALDVKHPAKSAFATASLAPHKTRASFFTQASSDLRLFSDPNIADMTSKQDHELEKIGIDKTAVFLVIPDEKATRNVLATLYIDQLYQALVDLANKNGGRIPRRVNFLLDEFGNLPAIPEFDKKLTVCCGRGMKFIISVQDITQLKKLYDKNAQTITGNCHNWIYILTADVETAKLISEKTGKYTVETESANSSIQSKGHSFGMGISTTGRPLLMPDEVLRWPSNEGLVLRARQFPARYPLPDLSLWRANKDYGFAATGDIDTDKELNKQTIKKRWEEVKERELEEASIWLPEIEIEDEEDETNEEVASSKDEEVEKNEEIKNKDIEEVQSVEIEEFNFNNILQSQDKEDDEEDEDFL
ncbi:MAG: type IV secretory system conjugative DNA transfer family protein [Peptostreptococcaceae bacterium]|jgi:type IV secretion system protein VirD4|nr:type IV secretory system conjugative DNA transfer family protein [Peptostreptococcaceae bacterium]